MKRRNFLTLAASAGVAGAMLPRLGRGATSPCPPPVLSLSGGQSVATACAEAGPGTAPAWWTSLAEGNWTVIANGAGQRLTDVVPNPLPISSVLGGGIIDLASDWCSASVNQDAGEYMFIAHGGHSSWAGNEGYALAVRSETPGWKRLTDPTPSSQWPSFSNEGDGRMLDGRPRSMHSSPEIYANGRVWFPILNSVSSVGGGGVNRLMTFNLNDAALVAARSAGKPLAWTSANLGPWEDWGQIKDANGNPVSMNTYIFGTSLYDPATGKIWYLGGKGEVDVYAFSIDTLGVSASSPPKYKVWHWSPGFATGEFDTWTFCAHDLRLLVAGDAYRQHIAVMNLDNPDAGWTKITNVSGTGYFGEYQDTVGYVFAGACYISQNSCAAIGHPKQIGRTIYKLQIPIKIVNGKKAYDPAGTWVWTTINGGGNGPDSVPGGDTYARWNMIRDMGDGRTAIIVCSDPNAVHVYKVPSGGL